MPPSAGDIERAECSLKRSIVKRDCTVEQFRTLMQLSEDIESDSNQKTLFRVRLRDLDSLLANFHADQDDILDQLIILSREEKFVKSHASIEATVLDNFYKVRAVAANHDLDNDRSVQNISSRSTRSNIQLPKILLPQFNGDLQQWCSYRDTFTSLVHENDELSDIERFHYLLSSLSGHALPIVRSIPFTEVNYIVAWEALHTRFDNKRLLVNYHLDAMFAFCPLTSESVSGLKRFLDTFQQNISAIKVLGVDDLAGFLLFYITSRCLDASLSKIDAKYYKILLRHFYLNKRNRVKTYIISLHCSCPTFLTKDNQNLVQCVKILISYFNSLNLVLYQSNSDSKQHSHVVSV